MSNTPNTVTQLRSPAKPTKPRKPTPSAQPIAPNALTARVPQACQMLNVGPTKLAELIRDGKLESFLCGKTRLITVRSLVAFAHGEKAA